MFAPKHLKNYISFFFMLFFMNNLLVAKADENKYFIRNKQHENNLNELDAHNAITFSNHDNLESQLKMFFGVDPENPEISFYPDLLIIQDSDSIRDMYKLKLNDMSIIK